MKRFFAVRGGLLPLVLSLLLAVGGCARKEERDAARAEAVAAAMEKLFETRQVKNEFFTLDLPRGWVLFKDAATPDGGVQVEALNTDGISVIITVLRSFDDDDKTAAQDRKEMKNWEKRNGRQFITYTGKLKSVVTLAGDAAGGFMQKHFTSHVPGLFPEMAEAVKNAYFTLELPPGWVSAQTTGAGGSLNFLAHEKETDELMAILVGPDDGSLLSRKNIELLRNEAKDQGLPMSKPVKSGNSYVMSLTKNGTRKILYLTSNGKQASVVSFISKTRDGGKAFLQKRLKPVDPKLFPASY